jgi:adenylate cyclase
MEPIVTEIAIECRSSSTALWAAVTDTERLNRAMGMNRIALDPLDGAGAARWLATTRIAGFNLRYEERPFEWVYPERMRILRRMHTGPLDTLEVRYGLAPKKDGSTVVTVGLTLTPRYRLLTPFLGLIADRTLGDFEKAIRSFDAEIAAGGHVHAGRRATVREHELTRAAEELRASQPAEIVDRLTTFLREADDVDAGRIRPYALADEWGLDRDAVLAACLGAVRAGLLELHWEVVCPSCRTATEAIPTLGDLADHGACRLCDIEFAVNLDEAVEATFSPAAAIRAVDLGPYCSGGPARTPHVLAQALLPAGGEGTLKAPSAPGRYRLFARGGAAVPVEVAAGAPAKARVGGVGLKAGMRVAIAPSGEVIVENPLDHESHAKIERVTWTDDAALARTVMTMPGFRRDFSRDILRPGMALKVARVGVFFSDLTGSTQLYSDAGDAAAFKLVHDHFDVVIGAVEKARGTLVKTIGDAVMAAFADDLDGLAACVALLHAFEEFRAEDPERRRTHIKLGLYGGPCYAVTANGVLDYFGQTVNLAARLQGEAKSGELVVTAELAARGIAKQVLPEAFVRERYAAKLKGVVGPVDVARIRVGK